MSNQLVITSGAKVRNLEGVLTGTSGIVSSVPLGGANGVATLDSGGKVPVSQLPASVVTYLGTWNAATNTPTLANGTGDAGDMYICNVAGTVNFGAGPITFAVGDWVLYGSGTWQKSNGQNGTVTSVAASITGDSIGITGSPITTAGTLAFSFAGTGAQYIKGDGTLATFPTTIAQANRLVTEVYNSTGATLTKGTVVYINGGQGNLPTVTKAIATGDSTSAQTYGVVQSDITNNNNGYVVVIGSLTDLDTQAYAVGTQLYLSSTTAGAWTSTKQYAPAHLVYVAIVVRSHPTQGVVEVRIQNGFELDELHNVSAQTPSNNDGIFYNSTTSLWESKSIATALGYTPANNSLVVHLAGTETITGTKTFSSTTLFDLATLFKKVGSPYITESGYTSLQFTASGTNTSLYITDGDSVTSNRLIFKNNAGYNYTFPATSGTISLTSDLAGYVDLTSAQTIGGTKTFSDATKNNGGILLQNGSSSTLAGYMNLGGLTNGVKFTSGGGISNTFTLPSATGYTFTFPNATGTVALTSDLTGGTVTSVALSAPTGFSVTGSPVTTSGTLALAFASGYSLPTTAKQSNWDDAYTWVAAFPTQTGNNGKFLTTDGSVLSWAANPLGTVTSVGLSSSTSGVTIGSSPITTSGTITIAIATASGSQNGLLSSTDWTTFNNKQNAITDPITGTGTYLYVPRFQSGGTSIGNSNIYDTLFQTLIGTTTISTFMTPRLGVYSGNYTKLEVRADTEPSLVLSTNASGTTPYTEIFNSYGNFAIKQNNPSGSTYPLYYEGTSNYLFMQTNGTQAIRIFSDQNVLLGSGTTNAGYKLDVNGTGRFSGALTSTSTITSVGTSPVFRNTDNSAGNVFDVLWSVGGSYWAYGVAGFYDATNSQKYDEYKGGASGYRKLYTNGTLALTIASTGATTLSATSAVALTANGGNSSDGTIAKFARGGSEKNFYISATNNQYVNLGTEGDIRFKTGVTVDQPYATGVNALILASTGAATFSSGITATGNNAYVFTGAGATTGYQAAALSNTGGAINWGVANSAGSFWGSGGGGAYYGTIGTTNATAFVIATNNVGRMLIDSSGNVGIGTSSPLHPLTVATPSSAVDARSGAYIYSTNSMGANLGGQLFFGGSYTGTSETFWASIAGRKENATDSDVAGYLAFATRPSGGSNTERMRITSGGWTKISNSGTYLGLASPYHELQSNQNNNAAVVVSNSNNTYPYGIYMLFTGTSPNDSTRWFYNAEDTTATRFTVKSNGGIANYQANDTNLSDIRTKKDIIPLESYWDKFKAIEVVKFKYKDQTHDDYNIGVIAQQVESVAPEFIDIDGWGETPEDGVPSKSVYTADLYHATIKVLQECMAKIEEQQAQIEELKQLIK